jgi:hypothetical protein
MKRRGKRKKREGFLRGDEKTGKDKEREGFIRGDAEKGKIRKEKAFYEEMKRREREGKRRLSKSR